VTPAATELLLSSLLEAGRGSPLTVTFAFVDEDGDAQVDAALTRI
jgi:hypothetical protein